ncbi:Dps family protein [Micrococcus luteus]|uniref:Dps family protein n=1 Tax=Micrococcus luteus TaxID=1270 RepID=UPI003D32C599
MAEKNAAEYTVPGLSLSTGRRTAEILQGRLHALNDLQLTLKHAHWNVVGPGFIGVHEMLDPQIELVRGMVDVLAERIATLGVSPAGTPGALVAARAWDDYTLGRASTLEHLAALDLVYDGVVTDHRAAIELAGDLDPVSEDMLIGQVAQLELFQWFMRSFLTTDDGRLSSAGTTTEAAAAGRVKGAQSAPAPKAGRTKKADATKSDAKKSKKK